MNREPRISDRTQTIVTSLIVSAILAALAVTALQGVYGALGSVPAAAWLLVPIAAAIPAAVYYLAYLDPADLDDDEEGQG